MAPGWASSTRSSHSVISPSIRQTLKGAAKVINHATGGGLGVNETVISMTVIFIVYSFIGGLEAAAWTDFFQGFLIIILSFMLIPLGWSVIGVLPECEPRWKRTGFHWPPLKASRPG